MDTDKKLSSLQQEIREYLKGEFGIEGFSVTNTHESVELNSINGFSRGNIFSDELFSEELPEGLIEDLRTKSAKSEKELREAIFKFENSKSIWLFSTPLG